MKDFLNQKKYLYGIIFFIVFVLISVGLYFGIKKIFYYKTLKQVETINTILDSDEFSKENCEIVLNFDEDMISDDNEHFDEKKFNGFFDRCSYVFDLSKIDLSLENCTNLIKEQKSFFTDRYIILDDYEDKINECTTKYLKTEFSTGTFFNVENDFKSSVNIKFSLDFYTDKGEENSEDFINNRIEAKNRLIKLLEVEPKVDFTIEDIYLYPNKAILNLPLQPLTDYKIRLKPYKTEIGKETNNGEFSFKTPENKYFGMKIKHKVSLFQNTNLPKFQILEYNSGKTNTKVKICKIPTETYAKIEVFRKDGGNEDIKDFFVNKIDNLEKIECSEKELSLEKNNEDLKSENTGTGDKTNNNTGTTTTKKRIYDKNQFVKIDFDFDDYFKNTSKNGLYYVSFSDKNDREYNNNLNYPIFFGVINSHITMKIGRNNETFFFVNDFYGNPLPNQEISLNLNNFKQKNKEWNRVTREMNTTYFSPLDKSVFSTGIVLGKTGFDGVLKVDLKEKVSDAFSRTFTDDWEFDYEGIYKTFFITSKSNSYLSYVNSTWNGGIAPWNFGYKLGGNYWYGEGSESNQDEINLSRWGNIEPEFYSHIYTDRVLYLPNEEVNIKAVVRKSSDLSISKDKEVVLKVKDSKNKEILNKNLKINEFGSINDTLKISQNAPLGNYNITLEIDDKIVGYGGFSVEVFKNPKFKNEILLETDGLNENLVKIDKTEVKKHYYWDETIYSGKFKIKAKVFSKYYNGASVKNADYKYKVYKQYYYESSYWDNCYYGCYWEPRKEFYSEGKGRLDENGVGNFELDVDFTSSYSDYKYIVEVTVTDDAGDIISGSNSIIAKLPPEHKKYNNDLSVNFNSETRFVKAGNDVVINGGLNVGKWNEYYDDKYVFVIKKKDYETREINDISGYKRPISVSKERLEKVMLIDNKNFTLTNDGKLKLNYKLEETGEYVFEYAKLKTDTIYDYLKVEKPLNKEKNEQVEEEKQSEEIKKVDLEVTKKILDEFNLNKKLSLEKNIIEEKQIETCEKDKQGENSNCITETKSINKIKSLKLDSIFENYSKKYFSVLTYGNQIASNPIINDNKIRVIPEKISYNLGEKAKVLIRLPVSNSKILWTIEKQGVIKHEYINVRGNIFFKEFIVDDSFIPNAYIGVVMVDTDNNKIPEYKVGYSEVVVDKTDKKSFVTITKDKETYKPREEVNLNFKVKDKNGKAIRSELTVMVVDDSLISLMGNVDLNSLEKFYRKLPFGIQTSITNIAMLKNYYFSRPGIVGGSGFGNFKGGDSAVSSRNIFKNTAYYNANVVTDYLGNAKVSFTLPDNLTNFRVMVVSNSKDNYFGYAEDSLEVRKPVIVEDKTPIILRDGDKSTIGVNIFNNTTEDIGFKVELKAKDIEVSDPIKEITIKGGTSEFVSWNIFNDYNKDKIEYTISALGNTLENSDKIENTIQIKESPILVNNIIKSGMVSEKNVIDIDFDIPENIDLKKSEVEVVFSNNKLNGIEKIISSLAIYPYGCVEQTTSTTLPNAILKKFNNIFSGVVSNTEEIDKNINTGLDRIKSMQTSDGGFAYWPGNSYSDLHITPYVVRSLIDMKDLGTSIPTGIIENSVNYLENNIENLEDDVAKAEVFWALSKAGKKPNIKLDLNKLDRHSLIAYNYGLVLRVKGKNKAIDKSIEKIKTMLNDESDSWYRNNTSDKAIFASMLMDYNYDLEYIEKLIGELYDNDWSSYYYSTQSKNNSFMAFAKYIEKYGKNNKSKFGFMIGKERNKEKIFWVGKVTSNMRKFTYKLSEILDDEKLSFRAANIEGSNLYVDIILKHYPEDKLKVKSYSNKMKVKREIFEVLDENKLTKCSDNYYYRENSINCDNVLKLHVSNIFEKQKLYKTKITVEFDDEKNRRNLNIEDYLPATFRVINSKFKTETSSVTEASKRLWSWDHIEFKPNVVMASTSYVWGNKATFEYYFRPEFEGLFTHPPVTSYMMYNPFIRANGSFNTIQVK